MPDRLTARVFVVRDNIDTDQIIPAQYLTLLPTVPEEYAQLGSFAMIGLPDDAYPVKVRAAGSSKRRLMASSFAGRNFGCGSSREHAPIALGAAGVPGGRGGELCAHLFPQQRRHGRGLSRMTPWTGCATSSRPATR